MKLLVVFIILGSLFSFKGFAENKQLNWYHPKIAPLHILEGPQKGKGYLDLLLADVISKMPEYRHKVHVVGFARVFAFMKSKTLVCSPTLLKTPEREKFIHFSIGQPPQFANGVMMRKSDLVREITSSLRVHRQDLLLQVTKS